LWHSVAELGWLGVAIPEAYGGSGFGHIELCAIAEELGRVVGPIPFAATVYVFAQAVMKFCSGAQKADLLPKVARGEIIGCLATAEREGVTSVETASVQVSEGLLRGVKTPVTDGDVATHAIVLARNGADAGLYLVDLSAGGVRREVLKSLDP